MNKILLPMLLVACTTSEQQPEEPNESLLSEALSYVQPETFVSLEQTIREKIDAIDCLEYETEDDVERWTAICKEDSNIIAEGSLEIHPNQFIQADHFVILQNGQPIFYFDGSIEFIDHKELLQLNVAGLMCGIQNDECNDGYIHLDMV